MKNFQKIIVLLIVICALLLTACQPSNPQNVEGTGGGSLSGGQTTLSTDNQMHTETQTSTETQTPVETQSPTENTLPMEKELEAFNTLFGNMAGWYNRALLCQYTSPTELKLEKVFYLGFADESKKPTDAEWAELKDQPGFDSNYDLIRLPVDKMNQVLTQYFGITLDDIQDSGFDNLVFMESTKCYYHMITDVEAVENFKATAVETQSDGSIRMSYTAGSDNTAFVAVLMPDGDGYKILSNKQV